MRRAGSPGTGTVIAWSLYELGATAFAMNLLSLHFPLDIATRVPRGNEKFSVTFGLSMAAVAVAAPFLGLAADRYGKKRFLVPFVSGEIRAKLPGAFQATCDAISVSPVSSNVEAPGVRANAYLPTALLWLAAAVPLPFFTRLPRPTRTPAGSSSLSRRSLSLSSSFREVLATVRSLSSPSSPSSRKSA